MLVFAESEEEQQISKIPWNYIEIDILALESNNLCCFKTQNILSNNGNMG